MPHNGVVGKWPTYTNKHLITATSVTPERHYTVYRLNPSIRQISVMPRKSAIGSN
jgi:hypothetical protein